MPAPDHPSQSTKVTRDAPEVEIDPVVLRSYERIGKSLASVRRLQIITVLSGGERTVEDIARRTGMSVANASQHLRGMLASRLLVVRREGPYAFYRLASDRINDLYSMLQELAAELDPEARSDGNWISIERLAQRMKGRENVVVLDVRPEKEYRVGRIKSARSVPLDTFDRRKTDFGSDHDVVVYGRAADCVLARAATEELVRSGLSVARLRGGFADWKASGLPVTRSARNK